MGKYSNPAWKSKVTRDPKSDPLGVMLLATPTGKQQDEQR
jgi:hypothetical protein